MINYTQKLTTHRERYPFDDIDWSVESDRGRILSAPALRRLQKRTQVFALELNASIRTRLTHSLEVAQTARFIARSIIKKLGESGLESVGLEGLENAFISTAEMTSLLHDIGNPPFGHFAEQTINQWIEQNVLALFEKIEVPLEFQELKEGLMQDIKSYDGNAQAIRVITKLQRLNLSYTQIISVLKYTRGAYEPKPAKESPLAYLKKKPGFYYSEKEQIESMQQKLSIKQGHRFPITYIMEAADDISYLTADLEDSVEKGILTLDEVYHLITKACQEEGEEFLLELVERQYTNAKKDDEPYQFNMFFILTRAKLINALVEHVSSVYVDFHEDIFEGSFNHALLEHDSANKYTKAIKILQDISTKHIYQNKDVQKLELQGYTIINGLFDIYKPLLLLSAEDFTKLINDKKIDCFVSMRLVKRLSAKQIVAYRTDIEKRAIDEPSYLLLELYYRTRLIVDFISGMTDDFALYEYQELMAVR